MRRATPVPANLQAINVSKFQGVLTQSGKKADVDFKIFLDTIVERIELDFNNFIQLGEAPSRQYRIEETSLSKLEGKRIFEKSLLQKKRESPKKALSRKRFFEPESDFCPSTTKAILNLVPQNSPVMILPAFCGTYPMRIATKAETMEE